MSDWNKLPSQKALQTTITNLKKNNITAHLVKDRKAAKKLVMSLLPPNAEVMTMTSRTLDDTGIAKAIDESSTIRSTKKILAQMERKKHGREMQQLGAAPEWAIGSVHAVTQDGQILVASNTGSQLPAYAYGADHVIWVVGAQKLVKDFNEGMKRIFEHTLPLESERARKAYGTDGSAVNKMLVITAEVKPDRCTLIFVQETLGF